VDEALSNIPVTLLDPVLAQVAEDCETLTPDVRDCCFALKVSGLMSRSFRDEETRAETFRMLLCDEFGVTLSIGKWGNAETDGSFLHGSGLVVNLEVKNEIGTGGGAIHVQNASSVAQYAAQNSMKHIRDLCVCPSLLIELAGPNMSLSGFVLSECAICDQLTPMMSLLWMPHNPLMLMAARSFGALRKGIASLKIFYQNLLISPPSRQLQYPYHNTFKINEEVFSFQYTAAFNSRCFTAVQEGSGQLLVIKVR